MSWNPSNNPQCITDLNSPSIQTVIVPRRRDVGGFDVQRALPSMERRAVGPFVFFDRLGTVQPIRPGEVNWMTAGRGIVHSERASDAGNPLGAELFGIQTWVALPKVQ